MLFHEASDDAVLALQPSFEGVDPFLAFLLGAGSVTAVLLEGAVAVLEEFLLPEVEGVDADVQFVTNLRDRHVVEQVPLKVAANVHNRAYLDAKRDRSGHQL